MPAEVNNTFEIKQCLCAYLSRKLGREVKVVDFTTLTKEDFEDADVVYAGPSCIPFSKNGTRRGWKHKDSRHILKTIDM